MSPPLRRAAALAPEGMTSLIEARLNAKFWAAKQAQDILPEGSGAADSVSLRQSGPKKVSKQPGST